MHLNTVTGEALQEAGWVAFVIEAQAEGFAGAARNDEVSHWSTVLGQLVAGQL